MKNIHILPTDKPSRLFYSGNSSKLTLNKYSVLFRVSPQNIYITSDEEIKVGDWFISLYSNSIQKELKLDCTLNKDAYKKIILTTDQSLDGVQAIDDEFLEWFVKNPSCEEVEINKIYNDYGETDIFDLVCTSHSFKYKIIIPKEEPKERLKKILGTKHPKQEINLEDIFNDEKKKGVKELIDKHKQETLEEAVKNYCIKKYSVWVSNSDESDDFINGAKWQQKNSEEEVIQLVSDWTDYRMSEDSKSKVTFKKWFEKFKK
jgi:hypothetical protein